MAALHLRIKFGANIFIQFEVIDIFPKFKMAAAAILDLLRGRWTGATPWGHSEAMPPTGTWFPLMKRELQWKNWLTRASLLAVKVVIVNCNGTVVVVPFVQCQ